MKFISTFLLAFFLSFFMFGQNPTIKYLDEYSNIDEITFGSVLDLQDIRQNPVSYRSLTNDMRAAFQEILKTEFDKVNIAGLSAAVIADDDIWKSAIGNSSNSKVLTTEMVLGMGSITKSITSITILKLEEEGLLTINDSLFKWLDNYENIDSNITIKQLLNHTSGIYNCTDNPKFITAVNADDKKIWKPEEVIDSFVLEPYFAKGEGWKYSNTNYILAGMVIESVTNRNYHDVVREKVLIPSGLDSIYLKPFESNNLEIAHFWADPFGGTNSLDLNSLGFTFDALFSGAWAAGAYMTRTIDIAKWIRIIASGDILNAQSKSEFFDGVDIGNNTYYGLGIIYTRGTFGEKSLIGHDGNIGYTSSAYYIPLHNLTIAVQCNDASIPGDLLQNIVTKIYLKYIAFISKTDEFQNINDNLTIFPNPTKGMVNIEFNNLNPIPANVKLFNSFGQKIYTSYTNNLNSININFSNLSNGFYYLKAGNSISKIQVLR